MIKPDFRVDERGRFFRAWCAQEFEERGISFKPVQANIGSSVHKGTIRGMHFQVRPALEAKLVRCIRGAMFDVILDLRPGSATFANWYGVELSARNGWMLYVPEHCAHGYQTLKDHTDMHYMTSQFYAPGVVQGARYDDPAFGIRWPLVATKVSEQDRAWPLIERSEAG